MLTGMCVILGHTNDKHFDFIVRLIELDCGYCRLVAHG